MAGTDLIAPGLFNGPGDLSERQVIFLLWPTGDDAATPGGLASPGAQDNSTKDPSQAFPPGMFVSPGAIGFPGFFQAPEALSSPNPAATIGTWSFGGALSATGTIDVAPPGPGGGGPTPGQIPAIQAPAWTTQTYAVIFVDQYGTRYLEMENAVITSVKWDLNSWGSAQFEFPVTDSKAPLIHDMLLKREVQIWRNNKLIWWGVPVRATGARDKVTVQCVGLLWYFSRRYFGPLHFNYIVDGDMELGGTGRWTTTGCSVAKDATLVLQGRQSLKLTATSSGDNFVKQTFVVPATSHVGGSVTIFVAGWVYIPNASASFVDASTTANSAVVTSASGFGGAQLFTGYAINLVGVNGGSDAFATIASVQSQNQITLDTQISRSIHGVGGTVYEWGAAFQQRGLYLQDNTDIISRGVVVDATSRANVMWYPIGGYASPTNQWIRVQVGNPETTNTLSGGLTILNDGKDHVLELRLYAPPGTTRWDDIQVYVEESISTPGGVSQDVGALLANVISYTQDYKGVLVAPKSDLNIRPIGTTVGASTIRSYQSLDNANVYDSLKEYADGDICDFDITWNQQASSRSFQLYPVRRGTVKPQYTLELDRNISDIQWDADGQNTSTAVRVLGKSQGSSQGLNQEVVSAIDSSGFITGAAGANATNPQQGLTLESVETATIETQPDALLAKAKTDLNRLKRLVITPQLTTHDAVTGDLIGNINPGDAVPIVMNFGWFQQNEIHRIQSLELKPDTPSGKETMVITTAPDPWFFSDGVTSASSTTLTSAGAAFQSTWVGMKISIIGAGGGGAGLFTSIVAVNSATNVTLGNAATVSLASATFVLGAYTANSVGDGQIVGGSNQLTSLSLNFTATDVGKVVVVGGAGPLLNNTTNQDLAATITAVLSPTVVVLSANAGVTVNAATVTINR